MSGGLFWGSVPEKVAAAVSISPVLWETAFPEEADHERGGH